MPWIIVNIFLNFKNSPHNIKIQTAALENGEEGIKQLACDPLLLQLWKDMPRERKQAGDLV